MVRPKIKRGQCNPRPLLIQLLFIALISIVAATVNYDAMFLTYTILKYKPVVCVEHGKSKVLCDYIKPQRLFFLSELSRQHPN